MYTKGKWEQVPWFDGKAVIVVKDDITVRLVIAKVEDKVGSDDANLIAASPQLLDACRHAAKTCKACGGTGKQNLHDSSLYPVRDCPFCKTFREAIAVATPNTKGKPV